MTPTVQVSWAKDRRLALEGIILAITPDVYPAIRFRLYDGPVPLHMAPNPGFAEGSRLFEVYGGPLAGMGPPQLGSGHMNGSTLMNVTNYYRVDVRYAGTRSLDARTRRDWNDMMHADSEKILHGISPSEAGPAWGDVEPYRWGVPNILVDNPPDLEKTPHPWAIMRLFLSFTYDIGRNSNY
jgi:hypothetical protein